MAASEHASLVHALSKNLVIADRAVSSFNVPLRAPTDSVVHSRWAEAIPRSHTVEVWYEGKTDVRIPTPVQCPTASSGISKSNLMKFAPSSNQQTFPLRRRETKIRLKDPSGTTFGSATRCETVVDVDKAFQSLPTTSMSMVTSPPRRGASNTGFDAIPEVATQLLDLQRVPALTNRVLLNGTCELRHYLGDDSARRLEQLVQFIREPTPSRLAEGITVKKLDVSGTVFSEGTLFQTLLPILVPGAREQRCENGSLVYEVRELVCDGCRLADSDARYLADLLKEGLTTVTTLSLRRNGFSAIGLTHLKKAIKYTEKVTTLDVEGCPGVSEEGGIEILQTIVRRLENNRQGISNISAFKRMFL